MTKVFQAFLVIFFIFSSSAYAETNKYDEEYLAMIELSKSMPEDFDFAGMRDLYSKTSFYKPYSIAPSMDFDSLFKKSREGDSAFLPDMEEYIERSFPIGPVHTRAARVYKNLGNTEKEEFHYWAARGFIHALMDSGHPLQPDNAPKVLIIPEEYMLARHFMDGKPTEQQALRKDGRNYDTLKGTLKSTGEEGTLWFDTTYIWSVANPF